MRPYKSLNKQLHNCFIGTEHQNTLKTKSYPFSRVNKWHFFQYIAVITSKI